MFVRQRVLPLHVLSLTTQQSCGSCGIYDHYCTDSHSHNGSKNLQRKLEDKVYAIEK